MIYLHTFSIQLSRFPTTFSEGTDQAHKDPGECALFSIPRFNVIQQVVARLDAYMITLSFFLNAPVPKNI